MEVPPVEERFAQHAREWGVTVDHSIETPSSLVAFGRRGDLPVVLKVVRKPGDEWHSGEVLRAFGGRGVVPVYEHVPGAMLLQRLQPGTPLVRLALDGRDDEATAILADVIRRMSPSHERLGAFPTVQDWGRAFDWYLASGDRQIPLALVQQAQEQYAELAESQRDVRLLHGDLQHYNVLFDHDRGWTAIDPKGVVGELEYEIGAMLRNPGARPDLFASAGIVERRIACFNARLGLDPDRVLRWAFAQAVLSTIWSVEDGDPVDATNSALMLATPILDSHSLPLPHDPNK
jgi:streptomycin 6-kinase